MPKFNGGIYTDDQGYLRISAGPCRGRRVHELIAEAKLGRKLRKDEVVHHVDGDKKNPDPKNLEVMNVNKHNAVSAKQYQYLKTHVWPKEKKEWDAYFAESANG